MKFISSSPQRNHLPSLAGAGAESQGHGGTHTNHLVGRLGGKGEAENESEVFEVNLTSYSLSEEVSSVCCFVSPLIIILMVI